MFCLLFSLQTLILFGGIKKIPERSDTVKRKLSYLTVLAAASYLVVNIAVVYAEIQPLIWCWIPGFFCP